jgi:hypothetical protein
VAEGVSIGSAEVAAGRGPIDLMKEALALYRQHTRMFLLTAAALFIPGSFLSSCVLSATLGPALRELSSYTEVSQQAAVRGQVLSRRIAEQAEHGAVDAKAVAELAREHQRSFDDMGRAGGGMVSLFKKVVGLVLGVFGWLLLFVFLYCVVGPLTQGALTIAVLDRMQGGKATWFQCWSLLMRHRGRLLSALAPAAAMGLVGYVLLLLPGMLLSCFFSFVAPVVLIEGLTGKAAIHRSLALVRSDWVRVALSLLSLTTLNVAAHALAAVILPASAVFWSPFLGDLVRLVLMPIPITLSALLYLDIRRINDGLSREQLAAELAALRLAS